PSRDATCGGAIGTPWDLHHPRHENPRRDDAFGVERAELDGLIDLRDGAGRRARHGRPEVARALPVDEVAPAVATLRLDERHVAADRGFEHVALAVDHPRFLALREIRSLAGGRVEGTDACARRTHAHR